MNGLPRGFDRLLLALPAEFRDKHREDMQDLLTDYASAQSRWARARIWSRAAIDVIWVGMSLRLGNLHGAASSPEGRKAASPLDTLVQDTRQSFRSLRRDYGLALLATLIVGLGVGASTTVFSVGNALLIRPLPFDEPDRLVWIANGEWGRGQRLSSITTQVFRVWDLQNENRTFEDVGGYCLFDWEGDHTLTGYGEPERLTQLRVTGNLFPLLGVRPALGRLFTPDEALQYEPSAILLTHGLWVRRFGADSSIVGSSLTLNNNPVNVVGVLPGTFDFQLGLFPMTAASIS